MQNLQFLITARGPNKGKSKYIQHSKCGKALDFVEELQQESIDIQWGYPLSGMSESFSGM